VTQPREEAAAGELEKELGRRIPFAEHLGIRLREKGGGRAVFELELRPELMNSFHAAHGGVVMTLLDISMAIAARTLDETAVGAITVEMKTSFISVGKGLLVAEGRCVHHGSSVSFCESEAKDSSGRTIARATGTFMLRKERKG
jgi:uncharacterized protein (TIGR00369 family)